jgi:hypothetical protein
MDVREVVNRLPGADDFNPNSEAETVDGSGTGILPVVSRAGPGKNLPCGRSLNSTGKMPVPLLLAKADLGVRV